MEKGILILERKIPMWVDTENVLKVLRRTEVLLKQDFSGFYFVCLYSHLPHDGSLVHNRPLRFCPPWHHS